MYVSTCLFLSVAGCAFGSRVFSRDLHDIIHYTTSPPYKQYLCVCACCHFYQDYVAASEDFQQSLELKKNQPIAMLYKGLTFFHRGLLKVLTYW